MERTTSTLFKKTTLGQSQISNAQAEDQTHGAGETDFIEDQAAGQQGVA